MVYMPIMQLTKDEEIREEIILAAQKIFQVYGLDKTTMEDIAKSMGKGKSTLYYYFPCKDEVYFSVAQREIRDVLDVINAAVEKEHGASAKLRTFFITQYREVKRRLNLYFVLCQDLKAHVELFGRIHRNNNHEMMDAVKRILLEGINNGEFKSIKAGDCEAIALACIYNLRSMHANILLEGAPIPESPIEMMVDIFIRGLK
jgi:AcrR family transcriptional regulator